MPTCILHYGSPKTGSTAIQMALSAHLTDPRFVYSHFQDPIHDHGNHSRGMATVFSDRPEEFHTHLADGISRRALARERTRLVRRLTHETAALAGRTLILSNESLSFLSPGGVQRLRGFLDDRQLTARPVGYLRSVRENIEGLFVERIKHRQASSVDTLEGAPIVPHGLITMLDTVFGRENVQLWKYDRRAFPDGCVVADFCLRLGINRPPVVNRDANRSLSLPAVRFLYAYSKVFTAPPQGRTTTEDFSTLVAAIGEHAGPRFRLHPHVLAPAMRQQASHLDWIEERVGASLRDGIDDDHEPSIRTEADLLDFSQDSLEWLAQRTGIPAARLTRNDPPAVAAAVHRLGEIAVAERVAARRSSSGLLARIGHRSREALFGLGRRFR